MQLYKIHSLILIYTLLLLLFKYSLNISARQYDIEVLLLYDHLWEWVWMYWSWSFLCAPLQSPHQRELFSVWQPQSSVSQPGPWEPPGGAHFCCLPAPGKNIDHLGFPEDQTEKDHPRGLCIATFCCFANAYSRSRIQLYWWSVWACTLSSKQGAFHTYL